MRSADMPWEPARFAHPRFLRVADLIARIASEPDWPPVATLDARFRAELATIGMRLVEAPKTRPALAADGTIDPATLYEVRIAEHGEIPTRPRNLHDLLNALVWAAFPRTKFALSRRLATIQRTRAAGRTTLPSTRTREHDRLAMVDEGGAIRVGGATWIFGHAIYEHAYAGNDAVRGAAIDLDLPGIEHLTPLAARIAIDHVLAELDLARAVGDGPGVPL